MSDTSITVNGFVTTFPLTTTLNRIWAANPCKEGKKKALKAAGKTAPDDEPITYAQIVEAVDSDEALWCCRAEPQHSRLWRLFAVWCARRVQPADADPRSITALDVAERHANGEASDGELAVARADAWDAAARAAKRAADAQQRAAARADAAWGAARAAARAADAADAAWDAAARAAAAAWDAAAWAAARAAAAAWDADAQQRAAQRAAFLQLVTTGTLPEP